MLIQAETGKAASRKYKFEIRDLRLFVKTLNLHDGLALDIARKLDIQPARYGLRRTMIKSLLISKGDTEFNANLYIEEVPRRLVLALIANDAFIGNKNKSPFNFEHFNVREVNVYCNGRVYPATPYNLDYATNNYVRAYHDMQENIGTAWSVESNGIDYAMFKTGWCIYVFSLTNSMENEPGFELIREGTTSITIRFKQPLGGNVTLIAYAEMDSLLMIDKYRTVTSDITV